MVDSGTTINLFGDPSMITGRRKAEISMNFSTNSWLKIVDEEGEIPGPGETKFHPEMIANVLSIN